MKKIIIFFGILFCGFAHSAQIVNVEYIHNAIANRWDITIPYNPALTNPRVAANMKYLLSTIDVANEMLNGEPTTYGTGEYATSVAADTVATNTAVDELVKEEGVYKFTAITNPGTSSFDFWMSAAGTFYIDWGDGTEEVIEKTNTDSVWYSHTYAAAGEYNIKLGGKATGYNSNESVISFEDNWSLAAISGSLGKVFPTLADGSQPNFFSAFNMTSITDIPKGLFTGIKGALVENMFFATFASTYITSIPEKLFAGINTAAPLQNGSFMYTFHECSGLTGPSARINGQYLYEIWPNATEGQVGGMYSGATGLSDYHCIPIAWGGGGETGCGETGGGETGGGETGGGETGGGDDMTYHFVMTTTSTNTFSFDISATGTFYVDWGDGKTEKIERTSASSETYSHSYASTGVWNIKLGGLATGYTSSSGVPAISFKSNSKLERISGSLGAIFPTLGDGIKLQPRFCNTFYGCSNLRGSIPTDLFKGVNGAPVEEMYSMTFYNCGGLTGSIPSGLFGKFDGSPAKEMFAHTFSGCSGLTGSIPGNLFAGISGAPADYMFVHTFYDCAGLTGAIPGDLFAGISGPPASSMFSGTFFGCEHLTSISENLFAGISGPPASSMFNDTFGYCKGLKSIPENLFAGISGPLASNMFGGTFRLCTGLTGPSARINGQYLYEIWPDATTSQVRNMYYRATGLSDYANIPSTWK